MIPLSQISYLDCLSLLKVRKTEIERVIYESLMISCYVFVLPPWFYDDRSELLEIKT